MQAWQAAGLAAAGFVTGHYLLLRAASGRIGDTLGALLLEGTATVGIAAAYAVGLRGDGVTTRAGIGFSMASGLCISAVSILLFYALRRGGPTAATGILVMGGGICLAAFLAPMLFREAITLRRAAGIALGVAAMVVLASDRS